MSLLYLSNNTKYYRAFFTRHFFMERRRKMQTTFMKLAIEEAKKAAKKGARQTFTNPLSASSRIEQLTPILNTFAHKHALAMLHTVAGFIHVNDLRSMQNTV